MKKLICIVCILAVLFVASACQASDPENLFSTSEGDFASTTESGESIVSGQEEMGAEVGYSYANMHKSIPSGNFMRCGNSVMFLSCDFVLYSYDMKTGEVTPFCKDATCDHTTSDCPANGIIGNLEQYDGKIYGISSSDTANAVLELRNGRFDPIIEDGVGKFFHSHGNLYVTTPDQSLIVYENGSTEPRTIVDEFVGYWITEFDGYLYYSNLPDVYRLDLREENPQPEVLIKNAMHLTDGEYIYYTTLEKNEFYRCRMDGSAPELLFDKPLLATRMSFDEEFFYFLLYTDFTDCKREDGADVIEVCRFPKDDPTKIEKISELDATDGCIYTVPGWDKIIVETQTSIPGVEKNGTEADDITYYVMGRDGSNPQQMVIPES